MKHGQESKFSESSLELFARLLRSNTSRYEQEALALIKDGRLEKNFEGVTVIHFLSGDESGYQISDNHSGTPEEVFFQKLDDDNEYLLKLLIDQMARSEVDVSFLVKS